MKITPIITNGLVSGFSLETGTHILRSSITIEEFTSSVIDKKAIETTTGIYVFSGAADGFTGVSSPFVVSDRKVKKNNTTTFNPNADIASIIFVWGDGSWDDYISWADNQKNQIIANYSPGKIPIYSISYINQPDFLLASNSDQNIARNEHGIEVSNNFKGKIGYSIIFRPIASRANPYPDGTNGNTTYDFDTYFVEQTKELISNSSDNFTIYGTTKEKIFSNAALSKEVTGSFEIGSGQLTGASNFSPTYNNLSSVLYPTDASNLTAVKTFEVKFTLKNVFGKLIITPDFKDTKPSGETGKNRMFAFVRLWVMEEYEFEPYLSHDIRLEMAATSGNSYRTDTQQALKSLAMNKYFRVYPSLDVIPNEIKYDGQPFAIVQLITGEAFTSLRSINRGNWQNSGYNTTASIPTNNPFMFYSGTGGYTRTIYRIKIYNNCKWVSGQKEPTIFYNLYNISLEMWYTNSNALLNTIGFNGVDMLTNGSLASLLYYPANTPDTRNPATGDATGASWMYTIPTGTAQPS